MTIDLFLTEEMAALRRIEKPHVQRLDPHDLLRELESGSPEWGTGAVVLRYDGGNKIALASNHQSAEPIFLRFDEGQRRLVIARRTGRFRSLADLNKTSCMRFLSNVFASGPFEISTSMESFHRDWLQVPAGFILYMEGNQPPRLASLPVSSGRPMQLSIRQLQEKARFDFAMNLRRQALQGTLAVEFSGGIDSGLIFAECRRSIAPRFVGGVTYDFAYHEFRRERYFREQIRQRAGGAVHPVSQEFGLPFNQIDETPLFHEPSINSTSWRMYDNTLRHAGRLGATCLLNGHGGDLLFLMRPQERMGVPVRPDTPSWIGRQQKEDLLGFAEEVVTHLNVNAGRGIGGYWHPSMLQPAALTRYAREYHPGISYRSGIVSEDFYDDCLQLWQHFAHNGEAIQKPFAYTLFGELLPEEVWRRPAKVNHLGNIYRGVEMSRSAILALFARHRDLIEFLDFPVRLVEESVQKFVGGVDTGNPMMSQLLALLTWWDRISRPD